MSFVRINVKRTLILVLFFEPACTFAFNPLTLKVATLKPRIIGGAAMSPRQPSSSSTAPDYVPLYTPVDKHLPIVVGKRGFCVHCGMGTTRYKCKACGCYLHVECFADHHE